LTRRSSRIALCALASLLISAAVALADPAGKSTLEETITYEGGSPFAALGTGTGQSTVVRKTLAKPVKGRAKRRRTITFFGQLTDPQIMDEMSPARGELIDPVAPPFEGAWRPQEPWALQNFDQLVRNMNDNRTSPFRQGKGKRARMKFVLNTGDMADNAQLNEVRWYIQVLEGGLVDPFSGKPIGPDNPCDQADDAEKAQLDAAVAARQYTGVQDYDDWRGEPADRYDDFWDPDEAPPGASSPYAAWPRYPGLLERAQQVFTAEGLDVPWYTARGNHDTIWIGTFVAPPAVKLLTTSCIKIFPNDKFDSARYKEDPSLIVDDLGDADFINTQLAEARLVPPDPDRRFLRGNEFKTLHGDADNGHGFKFVSKAQNRKSNGAAEYYAFTRNGIRFIAIDTNAEGGEASGNVDDPQYRWIEKELRKAERRNMLVIGYAHHPLRSQTATATDEDAPACESPEESQCDLDPRTSTPMHRGLKGKKSMRKLFLKYPHFIAFVVGHIHENEITPHEKRGDAGGFWEIATASELDWPQQGRLIEVMDNRDGTLSIFGTAIDTAAPVESPAPGAQANVFTDTQLGSLSRLIAANEPQNGVNGSAQQHAEGKPKDRNVELLIDDPRSGVIPPVQD
jgi:metallophosphoesterase (TIGR03767 family)